MSFVSSLCPLSPGAVSRALNSGSGSENLGSRLMSTSAGNSCFAGAAVPEEADVGAAIPLATSRLSSSLEVLIECKIGTAIANRQAVSARVIMRLRHHGRTGLCAAAGRRAGSSSAKRRSTASRIEGEGSGCGALLAVSLSRAARASTASTSSRALGDAANSAATSACSAPSVCPSA